MKVLIIGGTGTLSYPLTKLIIANTDMELTLINRGNNLKDIPLDKVNLFKSNINDKDAIETFMKDKHFDVVINFINFYPQEVTRDIQYFKGKCDQYIFISTNVVLNHEAYVNIDETVTVGNRMSLYGQNKALCEKVLHDSKDFPYTIVRPSHTYSESRFPVSVKGKDTWTIFDRILNEKEIIVHDGGQSIWPITHAFDFANLLYSLIGLNSALYENYHIMNPSIITWDNIYQEIATQLNKPYKPYYIETDILSLSSKYNFEEAIKGDKKYSNIFNIDKILELNKGFEFKYGLKEGVRSFLEYMEKHPEFKTIDEVFNTWSDDLIEKHKAFKNNLEI
ncbi:MAG: NAD-dependent epimerase/dehydratase family protein [Erysipelothrix sp.]|nr:NAD-dependent epimerase/dehydratase family protein [Erysipelothrix sp.]